MRFRWLVAMVIAAGVMLGGCKAEDRCWIDYTADTSFCNNDNYDCRLAAETDYDLNACTYEVFTTCLDEAEITVTECGGEGSCIATRFECEALCESWDDTCRVTCADDMAACADWFDPECEADCNTDAEGCVAAAGEDLDLDIREDYMDYIEANKECERERRACALMCYDYVDPGPAS